MKNVIMEIILIIIGTFIMSVGINLFLVSNELTTGGATGIATITYYLFDIPIAFMVLLINIPLFIIAIFKLGVKFCIRSLFATATFTLFLQIFQFESWLSKTSTDLIVSSIFGGMLVGLGISLVFKAGASTRWHRFNSTTSKK
ncbi:MAG: YitT family protein [Clostridia bacterium]|nr:YitT family protein [Clostridia bacterium]